MNRLVLLAALLPATALAGGGGQSSTEVTFSSYKKFFRGDQASRQFPEDSVASLELTADIDTELWLETTGLSKLAWPESELEHTWGTNRRAGHAKLDTALELEAKINVDVAGIAFSYKLWTRDYSWSKTQPIEGLLLPGSDQESVTITITDLLKDVLTYTYEDVAGYPVDIVLTGDIEPTTEATIWGTQIRSNKKTFTHITDRHTIDQPEVNEGAIEMESNWSGEIEANFNAIVWANIDLCEDITFWGFCYGVPIEAYTWVLEPDFQDVRSEDEDYALDIPAARADTTLVDLGNVVIGSSAKAQLNVLALSSARVSGDAWLDDENGVYTIVAGSTFEVAGNGQAPMVIEFLPTELGEFTTTLTIETNDMTQPTITVPVRGTGVEPAPVEEPDQDSGDNFVGEGGDDFGANACGCSSGSPAGSGLGVGLVALLGLIRRRRA